MKAFITGITGFVGVHLTEHLSSHGDEVLGCTRATSDAHHVYWDLADAAPLLQEQQQRIAAFAPDCIYHLAALSMPQECGEVEPTDRAWATNVEGTRRVLRLAASLPRRPRVLIVSSSHVYARSTYGFRVDENAPLGPTTAYGKTKLVAEEAALEMAGEFQLDVVIARAFQHAGPGQREPMMLPQWARQFAEGINPVRVHSLDTMIDFTDARDVVHAYRLLIQHGRPGTVYNVGSGSRQRTGDILHLLHQIADPSAGIQETHPGIKHAPIADVSRLVDDICWYPRVPTSQTIADTFAFWQKRVSATIP